LLPEVLRLTALAAVGVFLVGPYLTRHFVGYVETTWYYYMLRDFLAQVRAGIFPVYVGQGLSLWTGYPFWLAPAYVHTGAALDALTGRRLSAVEIQHLTLLWSCLAGAFSAYFCLGALVPRRRWLCAALACLYVSCPGLLAAGAALEMYYSFMTVPYLPLLLYGLVRGVRRGDNVAAAFTAAGLALLWAGHPPIALWCTTLTGLFLAGQAVFSGRFLQTAGLAVRAGLLFAVLSGGYFATVFGMGLDRTWVLREAPGQAPSLFQALGPEFATEVVNGLWLSLPGIYLPLTDARDSFTALQLGYALGGLFLIAVVTAVRWRCLELRLLVALALGLLVLLHPIPGMTWNAWAHLPRPFALTRAYPMLRLYFPLAGLAAFAAALALDRVLAGSRVGLPVTRTLLAGTAGAVAGPRRFALSLRRLALAVLLTAGVVWSLMEAGKIRASGYKMRAPELAAPFLLSENQPSSPFNWLGLGHPRSAAAVEDPVLFDRLVAGEDGAGTPLLANEEAARSGTGLVPATADTALPFEAVGVPGLQPLLHFRVEPGRRYLLTLRVCCRNFNGGIILQGGTIGAVTTPGLRGNPLPVSTDEPRLVSYPIWTSSDQAQYVQAYLGIGPPLNTEPSAVRVESARLTRYEAEELPIRVRSLVPYTATVCCDRACFLETHRQFVPGYEAFVNGGRVEVKRSREGMALVPLQPGTNEVKLDYRGTSAMRWALAMSAAGWLGLFGAAARRLWRRGRPALPNRTAAADLPSRMRPAA
jgi:hypothetical protein